jgi:hypothetical protein
MRLVENSERRDVIALSLLQNPVLICMACIGASIRTSKTAVKIVAVSVIDPYHICFSES